MIGAFILGAIIGVVGGVGVLALMQSGKQQEDNPDSLRLNFIEQQGYSLVRRPHHTAWSVIDGDLGKPKVVAAADMSLRAAIDLSAKGASHG